MAVLSSRTVAQLSTLCERHPTASKVVFVPHTQAGHTLLGGLARYGGAWTGLLCTTPLHYAQSLATWGYNKRSHQPLSLSDLPFFVASIVEELPEHSMPQELPHTQYISRMVAQSIATLRENGIAPEALSRHVSRADSPPMLSVLDTCYQTYHNELTSAQLYDDALVIEAATELVQDGDLPDLEQTIFAICDPTDLPNLTCALVNAARQRGAAFYRIGSTDVEGAPPHTAASYFGDVPIIDDTGQPGLVREISTHRAAGVQNEVDGVFQHIAEEGLRLDEVEIAYASVKPYLSLLSSRADALDIPLRFSAGQPSTHTLTGQALQGFYEWIQEDFDIAILIRMLRAGLFRVDKVQTRTAMDHQFTGFELATFLAGRSYEPGRAGYQKAFRVAREHILSLREHADEQGLTTEDEDNTLRKLESADAIIGRMIKLISSSCDLATFARNSLEFVEVFGPIDPSRGEEERRDLEEAARQVIYQKLEKLTHTPVKYTASSGRLAQMFSESLRHQFVRSERPKEGAASVVPLDSAGYSGRKHLFVVGMDGETMSWPSMDDALLRDTDRMALAEKMEVEMAASRGAADEAMWRIEQALARHQGDLHLFANVFDVESNESLFPAALFLEVEDEHQSLGTLTFIPQDDQLILDDNVAWIKARADVRNLFETPHPTSRDLLAQRYPAISDGEFARQQMASDEYTAFDGLLSRGAYPHLDIRGRQTLSTGRLETLAESPYAYFLKHVLDVAPLDEPALDDEAWMSMLRRGNILHRTFERFMRSIGQEPVTADHEAELLQMLELEIEAEKRKVGPPSERIEASARRLLQADARIFLHAEAARPADVQPRMHEVGFGTSPRWRRDDDYDAVHLSFENGTNISLRGRIDRVDELRGRGLSILDYKTGSAKNYAESDPLKQGAHLQWALYAYALEKLTDEQVVRSGYFFASTREMGLRIEAEPDLYRSKVGELLHQMGEMARNGCFPMNRQAADASPWKWEGFDRLFHDLKERTEQLKKKEYPADRAMPLFNAD